MPDDTHESDDGDSDTDDSDGIEDRSAGGGGGDPDDRPSFDAPPELVKNELETYGAIYPTADSHGLRVWWGRKWECERCGTKSEAMRSAGPGQPEPPSKCFACEREGPFKPHGAADHPHVSAEELVDLFPEKKVYDPPLAQFEFDEEGAEPPTFESVYEQVYDYIHTHWAAGDEGEWIYDMLTCYSMSTWFREQWDFVPHLLVQGKHSTGKTRLLNTLKNVSYRAVHNASLTSAYVYRGIDSHNLTMFISEYHDLQDDRQQEVDAVIKAGQKRGETIGRASEQSGGGYGVESFDPFTHVGISTQYPPDDDIISRCFEIITREAQRPVPRVLSTCGDLRSELLYLRFRYLYSDELRSAQREAEKLLDESGTVNRLSEKLWCILAIGRAAGKDMSEVIEEASRRDRERRIDTEEAMLIQAVIDEAFAQLSDADRGTTFGPEWEKMLLKISDIQHRFDKLTDRDVSATYIGILRRRVGLKKARRSDGVYISDDNLKTKLMQLAEENSINWGPTPGLVSGPIPDDSHPVLPDDPDPASDDGGSQEARRDAIQAALMTHVTDGSPADIDQVVETAVDACDADEKQIRNELALMIQSGRGVQRAGDRLIEPAN